MDIDGISALVTGGAGGLGRAAAERLAAAGARVVIADLPSSAGRRIADEIGSGTTFVECDVTDSEQLAATLDAAEANGPLRAVVHTPGAGKPRRIVDKDLEPMSLEGFEAIVRLNLTGTFNTLRLAAARMARNPELGGERGVFVMTASVAAYEGQVGQAAYTASKAGVAGLTLCAARDLSGHLVRVNTIAPGLFDTPLLARLPARVRDGLGASVPFPPRLGAPREYGALAEHIITNAYLSGETIRLDGAIRMAPR